MNKSIALTGIFALMAIGAISLYFVNQSRMAEQEAAMLEQSTRFENEQQRMEAEKARLLEQQKANEELTRQAMEARKMAERQAEQEKEEREKLVATLNGKLKREVEERRQAEAAQAELASKIAALEVAQKESRAALDALEAERQSVAASTGDSDSPPENETEALREKVEKQEKLLVALSVENETLKEKQEILEKQQIGTEEAIISAGGRVDIPYPEIRSANVRRREAIYFKERVAGHPTP